MSKYTRAIKTMNKQSAATQEIEPWMHIKAKTKDAQKGKRMDPIIIEVIDKKMKNKVK